MGLFLPMSWIIVLGWLCLSLYRPHLVFG